MSCSSVSWLIVYGNLNEICVLLLCENYISLNYVELVHSAFQVYYILLLLYIFILLIFEFAIETPGEGSGIPLQYSCLENPMDGGAC